MLVTALLALLLLAVRGRRGVTLLRLLAVAVLLHRLHAELGVLRGSDPLLADEYVVYTAHLDHIGELHAENPANGNDDRINNGALDNASGISVMLETARLFAHGEAPRRSIMFIAVPAEEKGLVGSEYFAMNPTVPIKSIVSEVNLDMPLLLYDFGDVIAFGAEHSSLGETVREAAGSFGTELTPDPFPEQNIFVRSDHYRFAKGKQD